MFKIDIPKDVEYLLNILKTADPYPQCKSHEAYIVGGCVRDSLLGRKPHDWDICTSIRPEQVCSLFGSYENITVIETGLQHGTVTAHLNGANYEITTFRIDGEYSDNRRPDNVKFVSDIYSDLARRDFTINAMAYDDHFGLIDPWNGCTDLAQGRIRCVGDPERRFEEDALRILRALRFASTYDFIIEEKTSREIHRCKDLLRNVSAERIQSELSKMICGGGVLDVLYGYADVMAVIIPELGPCIGFNQNNPYHEYTVYDHMARSVANYIDFEPDLSIRFALLLHDIGKPECYTEDEKGIGHFYWHTVNSANIAEGIMHRLKFDKKTTDEVLTLVLYHDADIHPNTRSVKRWLNKLGPDMLKKLMKVKESDISAQSRSYAYPRLYECTEVLKLIDQIINQQQCFKIENLAINGHDIIGLGVPSGPNVGKVLNHLLNMVLDDSIENDFSALLDEAKQYLNRLTEE